MVNQLSGSLRCSPGQVAFPRLFAEATGLSFTDLSNFNRHFRATTGTTPSRYRRIDQL